MMNMDSASCLDSDTDDSGTLMESRQIDDDTVGKLHHTNKWQDIIHTRVETFFYKYGRLVAR